MKTAIKERPILFSGEMVRAILAGRKTQTRRVVKPQPYDGWKPHHYDDIHRMKDGEFLFASGAPIVVGWGALNTSGDDGYACHYGSPGDRLWVRETWEPLEFNDHEVGVVYAATPTGCTRNRNAVHWVHVGEGQALKWQHRSGKQFPSIHMPRWASRITLEIESVRVERLHEIDQEGAMAEGCEPGCLTCGENCVDRGGCGCCRPDYRDSFIRLWDGINGKPCKKCRGQGVITAWSGNGDGSCVQLDSDDCPLCKGNPPAGSWEANPWVWCISFKRLP